MKATIKIQCKNCLPKTGIEIPVFGQTEKNTLLEIKKQSPLQFINYLVTNFNLSHGDAKYIALHMNDTYGHCNRCNFDKLNKEYIHCPKCSALNFNWKIDDKNGL